MTSRSKPLRAVPFAAAATVCLVFAPVLARAADAQGAKVTSLQDATQQGAQVFAHESFGGSGACESCHSNGGRTAGKLPDGSAIPSLLGAAAGFPRYAARSQSVITLSQQINRCIAGALHGTPPAAGAPELVNLETYVTSLSKGDVMGKQFN